MTEVGFEKRVLKFLDKLDDKTRIRVINKIESLKNDPFPSDTKRIVGHKEKVFRIRIGDYRVLYRINYGEGKVIIIDLDKRSKIYK